MKRFFPLTLVLGAFCVFSPVVFAGQIQNIEITPGDSEITLKWDALSNTEMFDQDGGYVIQYGTILSDIRNDKTYRNQLSANEHMIGLRAAGFDRDETYYFRVYSLQTDGRYKALNNGSKILKWTWQMNGTIDSELLEPNDPVIVDNSSTDDDGVLFDFGVLRAEMFDRSVHLRWSTPFLSSVEYDGYLIVISENSDLSSPIAEISAPRSVITSFVEGLTPNTHYYAAGYLRKGSQRFGKSATIDLTTFPEFTSSQQATYERRILTRTNLGIRHHINGSTTTTVTTTDTDDETDATDTTETTTVTTTTTTNPNTVAEIKARIAELKNLITKYQAEIRTLEAKLGSTTTSSFTSRLSSILDILRARRAAND